MKQLKKITLMIIVFFSIITIHGAVNAYSVSCTLDSGSHHMTMDGGTVFCGKQGMHFSSGTFEIRIILSNDSKWRSSVCYGCSR